MIRHIKLSICNMTLVVTSCLFITGCSQESQKPTKPSEQSVSTIHTSVSELKREIIKAVPDGQQPKRGQHVTVNYTGWLEENGKPGRQFDSSIGRGPFTFIIGVGQVIKGWDEGVLAMKIGEKHRLIIPANLGYGAYGAGDVIPPNATLIFDVELISAK